MVKSKLSAQGRGVDPLLGKYDPICCMVWPKFFLMFFFFFFKLEFLSLFRLNICLF